MDTPFFKTLRIAPTTQQGGTQTIQQSIYLTHHNPCGANLLIFKEMGLTKIRYIDLKNYIDEILSSDVMTGLFLTVRMLGTDYIENPSNEQLFNKYIYNIVEWASQAMSQLPVSENYYPGYLFRINVYDGSGTMLFDSYYPNLKPMQKVGDVYSMVPIEVLPSNPYYWIQNTWVFKASSAPYLPFVNHFTQTGFETLLSNFQFNQAAMQETAMAVASLLVDSANTRSFGVPKYGFSARQSLSPFAGITYNCSHIIDVNTIPDENGNTTLVESIFFRLSLEEDTWPPWAKISTISMDDVESYLPNEAPHEQQSLMSPEEQESILEEAINKYRAQKYTEFLAIKKQKAKSS